MAMTMLWQRLQALNLGLRHAFPRQQAAACHVDCPDMLSVVESSPVLRDDNTGSVDVDLA